MKCLIMVVLSLAIISMMAGTAYSGIGGSIVGMWLFDELEDNKAKDSSGNGHDGEIEGNFNLVEGEFGSALSLEGSISIPHEDSLNLVTWSITTWVKLEPGARSILQKEDAANMNYHLKLTADGRLYGGFTRGPGQWRDAYGKKKIATGEWRHVAVTRDQEALRVYVDGKMEGELVFKGDPSHNKEPITILFGAAKGAIDDLALFDRGLTADEVKFIMTKGLDEAKVVSQNGKLATTWGKIKAQS